MTPEEQAAVDAAKKEQNATDKKVAADKKAADDKAAADQKIKDDAEAKAIADATKKAEDEAIAADKKAADDEADAIEQAKISKQVEEKRSAELAKANDNALPPEFIRPSVGRIVHFFPDPNDKQALENGVNFIAGIVVREYGNHRADIRIFPVVEEQERFMMRWNVPHKIKALHAVKENSEYWDWPGRV